MKQPLIPKGSNFTQIHEDFVLKIQTIRKKNDQYQILVSQQMDSSMAQEVFEEKQMIDAEILNMKKLIEQMEYIYKELPQKNKMKDTKKEFQKQLSRYKQVSDALMENSSIRAEMRRSSRNSVPEAQNNGKKTNNFREVRPPTQEQNKNILQQKQMDIDFNLEHNILMGRKKDISQAQQQLERVYQIHVDQSNMVNQQGNMVNIIGQEMFKAQGNVENTNELLDEAKLQQKKSRKKCICLVFFVLFIVLIGGVGLYFYLDSSKKK